MSLFSLNNILLNESTNNSTVIDIDDIGYLDNSVQHHSFIQEGYDFILEMNAAHCRAEKEFYTRVLGSYGDDNIINESFSDFFAGIKKIIDKFIAWLKKVFKEFVVKINALFSSEKYLKKNEKLLNKFSHDDEFEFNGYNFTHVSDDNIPEPKAVDAFQAWDGGSKPTGSFGKTDDIFAAVMGAAGRKDKTGFFTAYGDKDFGAAADAGVAEANRKEYVEKAIQSSIDTFNDNIEDYYDWFRGMIINKEPISSNDYAEELHKIFRHEEDSPEDITIDSSFISDCRRRFNRYKDEVKEIEKNQKALIKDYEDLEKHLDKLIKYNKDTHTYEKSSSKGREYTSRNLDVLGTPAASGEIYSQAAFDKMNTWVKLQSSKVSQMCQIHTQAFSAKLEAAKDCFNQDKKILYKALQQITKRSNKEDY